MNKPVQGPMFSQLSELRNRIINQGNRNRESDSYPTRKRWKDRNNGHNDTLMDPSPSPMNWKGDGIDHINIWEKGETELGVVLNHSISLPFNHSLLGRFGNMEAFWHYVQSEERDDRIRMMEGYTLKNFARKLTPSRVINFRAIIMDANYQRIKQYEPIVQEMINSTLPFDCYYVHDTTKLRTRPNFFKWLTMGYEEIRKALKENREPDFNFLLEREDSSIYQFLIPQLNTAKKQEVNNGKEKSVNRQPKSSSLLSRVEQVVAQQASGQQETEVKTEQSAQAQGNVNAETSSEMAASVVDEARQIEGTQA